MVEGSIKAASAPEGRNASPPSDWTPTRLRDVLAQDATYGIVKAGTFVRSGIPMLRGGDIKNGRIARDMPHVSEAKSEEFKRTVLRDADVVIALVGYPGECAVVPPDLAGANISRAVGLLRPSKVLSPDFLSCYLNSDSGRAEFLKPSAGSAQIVVNLKDLNNLTVPLPRDKAEQKAIAAALSDADALIEGLESLIAKKRAIKQGAMQELLTGRRRLEGFEGEWQRVLLGELGAWVGGGTPSMDRDDYWTNGTVPWVSSADIRLGALANDLRLITERAVVESSARVVPKGSIGIVTRSGILRRFLPVCLFDRPIAVNQDIKALIPSRAGIGGFIAHSIIHQNDSILASCLKSGTTVESIELSWLKQFPILVPPTEGELNAVCSVLDDYDAEIDALSARLAKARQIKQGMMQELLTGRIRLV